MVDTIGASFVIVDVVGLAGEVMTFGRGNAGDGALPHPLRIDKHETIIPHDRRRAMRASTIWKGDEHESSQP